MELRQLRYFVAVAEELNFTRAAARLYIAQPSLSSQIRALEDEVGVHLVERSKRHVALTETGRVFLDEARMTLAQANRALRRARETAGHTRSLSIGFIPSAEVWLISTVLPALRMRFPDLDIKLSSIATTHLDDALHQHQIDVAFMRAPVRPDLQAEVVFSEPFVVALPATHPLNELGAIPAEALKELNFISMDPKYAGTFICETIEIWARQNGLHNPPIQNGNTVLLCLNLVGAGLGYSILPSYVQQMSNPSVCIRPLCNPPMIDLLVASRREEHSVQLATLLELVHTSATLRQDT